MDRNKHTWTTPWKRLSSSNVAVAAFTEPAEYLSAAPAGGTGRAVFDLHDLVTDGKNVPDLLDVQFFGTNAENETLLVYVRGYQRTHDLDDSDYHELWLKEHIAEFTATLGAGTLPGTNEFTVDTLVMDVGSSELHHVFSPGSDKLANVLLDPKGCRYLEFWFAGGTGATGNAFLRGIS